MIILSAYKLISLFDIFAGLSPLEPSNMRLARHPIPIKEEVEMKVKAGMKFFVEIEGVEYEWDQ